LTHEQLVTKIPSYDALIVRSATQVDAAVIDAAEQLRIIGRAGVSVDNIDVDAATERGIIVCNAPTSNIVSAAEHTMALLLACARKLCQANHSMKEHQWDRNDFIGTELYQHTLAIFGLGRIGGLVAERAQAFGMHLIGYDPYCSVERAEALGVKLYNTVDEVLERADCITVHLPRTKETVGMFGPDEFSKMKDGVILINTARGGIYDVNALADFIAAGKVAACGIDMWEDEPCTNSPLHEFDQAILTPHIGASTHEAQTRAGVQIAEYISNGLDGSIVPTALNMAPLPPEVLDVVGPYVPACQLMGSILAQIQGDIPRKLRITATGSLVGRDLSILTAGALDGILSYKRKVTPVNAEAVARRHGIDVRTDFEPNADEYASTVILDADALSIACTLTGSHQTPRIVSLLGFKIDIIPEKYALIFQYDDAPGRIGTIGTVLGKAGINITTMQIGTEEGTNDALVYMNVENDVPKDILATLHESLNLKNLWYIQL
jgi:D-3-phosphoglycerate dehydrogenase